MREERGGSKGKKEQACVICCILSGNQKTIRPCPAAIQKGKDGQPKTCPFRLPKGGATLKDQDSQKSEFDKMVNEFGGKAKMYYPNVKHDAINMAISQFEAKYERARSSK